MGCALALSLTLNIQAQVQKSPPGTYYSAKDPDLVPLPFNPHPELETVEVSPGIFVYDDTGILDTQQQIISRKIRKAAAERAKQIACDPVLSAAAQAAQLAAQEAAWAKNREDIAPWIHANALTVEQQPVSESLKAGKAMPCQHCFS